MAYTVGQPGIWAKNSTQKPGCAHKTWLSTTICSHCRPTS